MLTEYSQGRPPGRRELVQLVCAWRCLGISWKAPRWGLPPLQARHQCCLRAGPQLLCVWGSPQGDWHPAEWAGRERSQEDAVSSVWPRLQRPQHRPCSVLVVGQSPSSPAQIQRKETRNSLLQGRSVKGFEDIFLKNHPYHQFYLLYF